MRRSIAVLAIYLSLSTLSVTSVNPQSQADWNACRNGAIDAQLAACTRLIERYDQMSRRDRSAAFDSRASVYNETNQSDLAIRDLDTAIRLDPTNASAFNNRGNAYKAKSDWDRAILDYDEAIRLNPKFVVSQLAAENAAL